MVQQLDRALVGPVHVVEHEHQARRAGQRLQQGAYGAVQPVPFRAQPLPPGGDRRGRSRQYGQYGQDAAEQVHVLVGQGPQALRPQVGERVGDDPERHLLLELRRLAPQNRPARRVRPARQLGEQPRLADARISGDHQEGGGDGGGGDGGGGDGGGG
nr:hypothetical protein [Streptomyces graminofaciens]